MHNYTFFGGLLSFFLQAIDQSCVHALEVIEGTATSTTREQLTPQNFNNLIFETFTTRTTDGRIVELKPGGKHIPVTYVFL
jgi:hypothetical protein